MFPGDGGAIPTIPWSSDCTPRWEFKRKAKAKLSQAKLQYKSSNLVSTRPSVRIFLRSKKEEEEAEDHFRKGAITINKLTVNSYFGIDVVTKQ